MARRRPAQLVLRPIYVRPDLSQRERVAKRDYCRAAFRDDRHRPKRGQFDPLWLRLGMRAHLVEQRAGWVVNNPDYDQILRRRPDMDPSLPGVGWLREVYRWRTHDLVTLPGTCAEIEARLERLRAAEMATQAPGREQPMSLFDFAETEQA